MSLKQIISESNFKNVRDSTLKVLLKCCNHLSILAIKTKSILLFTFNRIAKEDFMKGDKRRCL